MAKIATLTMKEPFNERIKNLQDVGIVIKDYEQIDKKYQEYIQTVYSYGILSGYPDKTIRGENTATRAEACTLLVRLLDDEERLEVEIYEWSGRATINSDGYILPHLDETKLSYSIPIEKGELELKLTMLVDDKEEVRTEQKDAIKIALRSKIEKETIDEIITYIDKKDQKSKRLFKRSFVEGDYKIVVESEKDKYFIRIEVYNKGNI